MISSDKGELIENKNFDREMQKKVNQWFSTKNPYFGKCITCDFEICMKCGLDYHESKSCKNVLDSAMKDYF